MESKKDSSFQWIWRAKFSPRVKVFFWNVQRQRLSTPALLIQGGYLSDGECVLCTGQDESVQHLLCSLRKCSVGHWSSLLSGLA